MITFVVFSLKRAWEGFWRNAVMSLAATATMVLMLLLLAGFWVINTGLLAGLEFTEQKVNVVADLYDNVTPGQVKDLRARIAAMPEVSEVVFVSREDALKRFRDNRRAQGEEDLTRFLDTNPFHQSLEIALTDATLYDNVTPGQVKDLRARIAAMPEVSEVVFVSREDALKRFRDNRRAQGEEDLTRFLDTNPFHQSLEIALTDATLYSSVYDRLVVEPTVQLVKNQQDLVERVLTVTNFLRTAGGVILAVIGVIVLFIIVNAIRLAVVARAEEIDIMRLVGASDAFIRWPFVFEGALVGLFGAAVALGVLALGAEPLGGFMYDFFRVLPLTFGSLSRDVALLVFGTGVGLGIVGSWVSVRTYLIK